MSLAGLQGISVPTGLLRTSKPSQPSGPELAVRVVGMAAIRNLVTTVGLSGPCGRW